MTADRIAYFVHLNLGPKTGVFQKVLSQVLAWRALGREVKLFCVTANPLVEEELSQLGEQGAAAVWRYANSAVNGLSTRLVAFASAREAILGWRPRVIYTRRDVFYPPVRSLMTRVSTVVEVNSDELTEIWQYSKPRWLYQKLTRRYNDRAVSAFVFVTSELSNRPYYRRLGKPALVLGNAADFNRHQPLPPNSGYRPQLVFIGQKAFWHGIDKVIRLAFLFPSWRVVVVGYSPKDLGQTAPRNLECLGTLDFSEYRNLICGCDVGIGTLGLYRKGMQEASPLKTREYLALGLPVIIGYLDTDFPDGAPFLLRLPNAAESIERSQGEIRCFVEKWKGKRVERDAVRDLGADVKERRRLSFFDTLSSRTGPRTAECQK